MAATINATAKDPAANSYTTLAEGDTYFEKRTNATDWSGATDDAQTRALIQACEMMERLFDWNGNITTDTQRLRLPRYGLYDPDSRYLDPNVVPEVVKNAQLELALFLLKSDRLAEPGLLGQGMSAAKVGTLDVTIDPNAVLPYIPQHVLSMLEDFATLKSSGARTGMKMLDLERA